MCAYLIKREHNRLYGYWKIYAVDESGCEVGRYLLYLNERKHGIDVTGNLYVDEGHRKRGIATAMIENAQTFLREISTSKGKPAVRRVVLADFLRLNGSVLENLFRRLGYERSGIELIKIFAPQTP